MKPSRIRVTLMHDNDSLTNLESKLYKLEKMLEMTHDINEPALQSNPGAAAVFAGKMQGLIHEIHSLDRLIESDTNPVKAVSSHKEMEVKTKIKETVKRLAEANAKMVASIKVQQEMIGDKIVRLKKKKAFLKSTPGALPQESSLVDTEF